MTFFKMQRTLAGVCEFPPGVGLHSGLEARMVCAPAPANSGIRFCRVDLPGEPEIPALMEHVDPKALERRTALSASGVSVETVEHLLASFAGLGIDNAQVRIDAPELPFYDGGAGEMARRLSETGSQEQDCPQNPLTFDRPVVFCEGDVEIVALPSREYRLTFFADFPHPAIGRQSASFPIEPETFCDQVAPARTFVTIEDIEKLRAAKLIKGGDENCAVVFGPKGPLNTELRYPNEPARHKLLDLLGDLCLIGRPIQGHIIAFRSGHRSHAAFSKRICAAARTGCQEEQ